VGNVDAGKSTTLGVLTHNVLDNGRGMARLKLFNHQVVSFCILSGGGWLNSTRCCNVQV
jgi:GTPase